MFIFIISVIIVSFICLCFFKGNFWENRYLILLICGGVALVVTLTTNLIIRGHLQTKTEIVSTSPLYTFYVQDSLFNDSLSCINNTSFIKDFDFINNHNASEFFKLKKDSLHKQIPVTILLYTQDKKNKTIFVGTFWKSFKQDYDELSDVYLAPSQADNIAYRCKKKLVYDVPKSNWLTGFSLPRINTIVILYIPPREYKLIPDSLIRKIPF
jgi:hypothetical protein